MDTKQRRLTHREQAFAAARAAGLPISDAAKRAGFTAGYHAEKAPAVRAEIARIQQERLFNEVLPLAVQVHIEVLTNPLTPAGARVQAVKLAYDRTLGLQDDGDRKAIDQMTPQELANELQKIKARKSELARVVDAEVIEDPAPAPGVLD